MLILQKNISKRSLGITFLMSTWYMFIKMHSLKVHVSNCLSRNIFFTYLSPLFFLRKITISWWSKLRFLKGTRFLNMCNSRKLIASCKKIKLNFPTYIPFSDVIIKTFFFKKLHLKNYYKLYICAFKVPNSFYPSYFNYLGTMVVVRIR